MFKWLIMKKFIILLMVNIQFLAFGQNEKSHTMDTIRYNIGLTKLKEIDGTEGEKVIQQLETISPDLAKYIIEYAFSDVYSREVLDNKTKELIVVAALTVKGNNQPQLKVHLNGALNTGNSINEIKEIILQMAVYGGFPVSINGMNTLKEVIEERKSAGIIDDLGKEFVKKSNNNRLEIGIKTISQLKPNQYEILIETYQEFSPELVQFIIEFAFGDIYSRDNVELRNRQLATITSLVALGNASSQLKFHLKAGLNIGISQAELKEVMVLMTVFAGFPNAINGMNVLKSVLEEDK